MEATSTVIPAEECHPSEGWDTNPESHQPATAYDHQTERTFNNPENCYFDRGEGANRYFGAGTYLIDVNGDQSDDLVIGDPALSYAERTDSGIVYIFYGPQISSSDESAWSLLR